MDENIPRGPLKCLHFFILSFFFFSCSTYRISNNLSSRSMIHSSVSSNLLLFPSREFLISVSIFFSLFGSLLNFQTVC